MIFRSLARLLIVGILLGITVPSRAQAGCIEQYVAGVNTAALESKAVSDLTHAEARDLIIYLYHNKFISFPPKQGFEPTFTADCKVRSPYQLASPGSGASQRLAILAEVAGVRYFRYAVNANRKGTPVYDKILFNLQPRMVVALYHLAVHLKETYGVDEIYTAGIGAVGQGDHQPGIAIDFVGAYGSGIQTLDNRIFVEEEWGNQPVPRPNGATLPDWPSSEKNTSFRLAIPSAKPFARDFFLGMYNYFAQQFAGCPNAPIGPRCGADRLKHPDYFYSSPGTVYGREGHRNHIHAGMDPTGR